MPNAKLSYLLIESKAKEQRSFSSLQRKTSSPNSKPTRTVDHIYLCGFLSEYIKLLGVRVDSFCAEKLPEICLQRVTCWKRNYKTDVQVVEKFKYSNQSSEKRLKRLKIKLPRLNCPFSCDAIHLRKE